MYHAKQQSGSSYEFYSQEMSAAIKKRLAMHTALHQAVKNQEFVVYYQPIVHLETGKFIGVEALLRWDHPEKGLILPDEFIEILEETGLIIQVTEWVLSQVGDCYQQLRTAGLSKATISVNFTPQCFSMINMATCIENFLGLNRLPPQNLIAEVTENILISAGEHAVSAIQQLKDFGIKIALDDFGTGYSSLSHLRSFPIDIIKIDREFVQDVTMNEDDAALASAIISMAHHLGLKVIAEGIETTGQLEFMRKQRCDAIQGFLVSRPVPIDRIIAAYGNKETNHVVHIKDRKPT
jgi:EAL domain-containing protein (putative c-di-GMP-specific phosphodiesterase class I)